MNVRVLNSVLFIALFVLLISAQPVAAEDQLPASAQNGPTAKPDEQAQALEPAGGEKQIAEDAKADQDVKNEDPSSPEELFALAMKYETGKGVTRNPQEAYAWANLSAAQGYYEADDLREEIARSLTQQELAKAQNISKMYYKKYVEPF